ncbi:MAG: sulfurtransferase TusA family protein [Oleiphilaceae bacterium]|nr:sulfurtransferase TusA family protein [Oleiphilaceae bacterium]
MSQYDELLDVSGEACPMPLLKAKMALNKIDPGKVLKVIATDAGSVRDFSAFIKLTPHELEEDFSVEGMFVYYIKKH